MSWQKVEDAKVIPVESRQVKGGLSFGLLLKISLFLISASSITFEINLTRLFSTAQFYHFAFMIVSTVLLGSAAGGIILMAFPQLGRNVPGEFLSWTALCTSLSTLGAYLVFNHFPFDSFSISWDIRQAGVLVIHYLLLALPFMFCGLIVSFLLDVIPEKSGSVYGVNLAGSSAGCLLALSIPGQLGGDGMVLFCSGISAISVIGFWLDQRNGVDKQKIRDLPVILAAIVMILAGIDAGYRCFNHPGFSWMSLKISPYKSLSYILQYPGSKLISEEWNAFSRVDVVDSEGIRSLPGLSYRYQQSLPVQNGLYIDGDDLSPIIISSDDDFTAYMPSSLAFELRPDAKTMILEPRAGLDIFIALEQGAKTVTVVEQNPLIITASDTIYSHPNVATIIDFERSTIKRSQDYFDIIVISLTSTYHPIQSGAYSLAEDYRYTVEALTDALARLNRDGILVITRWLQNPPSEDLRAFALAIEATEQAGGKPQHQLVAFRGYNTSTLLIKNGNFTPSELVQIRDFLRDKAFDISYAPDIRAEETNRFNILPESIYFQTYIELIKCTDRQSFYRQYPYDISPPTDDRPFMGHYFKWLQARQILAEWGKTWQPFGGAGYLVIIGLLILTIIVSSGLVLFPWIISKGHHNGILSSTQSPLKINGFLLAYFACIGFAYLLVEIPLIQKFILYLGQPSFAFAIVLFALLFFSSCGSLINQNIPLMMCIIGVTGLVIIMPLILPIVFENTLGFEQPWRILLSILMVSPAGILMGVPFPAGLRWAVKRGYANQIPWFWGMNGAASVVSAILAAMLALVFGFSWVLRIGGMAYFLSLVMLILDSRLVSKIFPRR